jgi:hypothetical protein
VIVDQSHISWQSLMRWDRCCFEDRNESKDRSRDEIMSDVWRVDDDRFKEALIRDAENINDNRRDSIERRRVCLQTTRCLVRNVSSRNSEKTEIRSIFDEFSLFWFELSRVE